MRFSPVTVYRYKNGGWEKRVLCKAHVHRKAALLQQNGERNNSDTAVVRVFADGGYIRLGDKLIIGCDNGSRPDTETALTVCEISDNTCLRRNGHYRISAR